VIKTCKGSSYIRVERVEVRQSGVVREMHVDLLFPELASGLKPSNMMIKLIIEQVMALPRPRVPSGPAPGVFTFRSNTRRKYDRRGLSFTKLTTPVSCRLHTDGLWGRAMNSWTTAVAMDYTHTHTHTHLLL